MTTSPAGPMAKQDDKSIHSNKGAMKHGEGRGGVQLGDEKKCAVAASTAACKVNAQQMDRGGRAPKPFFYDRPSRLGEHLCLAWQRQRQQQG